LDSTHCTAISWAAKSACTHVLVWHLARIGLLEEAEAHHSWLHRYREEKYYAHDCYQKAKDQILRDGTEKWTLVKVVRDPVKRCVSSYRHALKHGYENQPMSRRLGRDIDHLAGYSFETFIDYLERIDLHHCNIHHRSQAHSLDKLPYRKVFLINVDEQDLSVALERIDSLQGRDAAADRSHGNQAISRAARRHASNHAGKGNSDPEIWRQCLRSGDVDNWPKEALQNAGPAVERIKRIYASDYAMIALLSKRSADLRT